MHLNAPLSEEVRNLGGVCPLSKSNIRKLKNSQTVCMHIEKLKRVTSFLLYKSTKPVYLWSKM